MMHYVIAMLFILALSFGLVYNVIQGVYNENAQA